MMSLFYPQFLVVSSCIQSVADDAAYDLWPAIRCTIWGDLFVILLMFSFILLLVVVWYAVYDSSPIVSHKISSRPFAILLLFSTFCNWYPLPTMPRTRVWCITNDALYTVCTIQCRRRLVRFNAILARWLYSMIGSMIARVAPSVEQRLPG